MSKFPPELITPNSDEFIALWRFCGFSDQTILEYGQKLGQLDSGASLPVADWTGRILPAHEHILEHVWDHFTPSENFAEVCSGLGLTPKAQEEYCRIAQEYPSDPICFWAILSQILWTRFELFYAPEIQILEKTSDMCKISDNANRIGFFRKVWDSVYPEDSIGNRVYFGYSQSMVKSFQTDFLNPDKFQTLQIRVENCTGFGVSVLTGVPDIKTLLRKYPSSYSSNLLRQRISESLRSNPEGVLEQLQGYQYYWVIWVKAILADDQVSDFILRQIPSELTPVEKALKYLEIYSQLQEKYPQGRVDSGIPHAAYFD